MTKLSDSQMSGYWQEWMDSHTFETWATTKWSIQSVNCGPPAVGMIDPSKHPLNVD